MPRTRLKTRSATDRRTSGNAHGRPSPRPASHITLRQGPSAGASQVRRRFYCQDARSQPLAAVVVCIGIASRRAAARRGSRGLRAPAAPRFLSLAYLGFHGPPRCGGGGEGASCVCFLSMALYRGGAGGVDGPENHPSPFSGVQAPHAPTRIPRGFYSFCFCGCSCFCFSCGCLAPRSRLCRALCRVAIHLLRACHPRRRGHSTSCALRCRGARQPGGGRLGTERRGRAAGPQHPPPGPRAHCPGSDPL